MVPGRAYQRTLRCPAYSSGAGHDSLPLMDCCIQQATRLGARVGKWVELYHRIGNYSSCLSLNDWVWIHMHPGGIATSMMRQIGLIRGRSDSRWRAPDWAGLLSASPCAGARSSPGTTTVDNFGTKAEAQTRATGKDQRIQVRQGILLWLLNVSAIKIGSVRSNHFVDTPDSA